MAFNDDMFEEGGLLWPGLCKGKTGRYLRHQYDAKAAIKLIPKEKRGVAVQAGGHIGLWPLYLARRFEQVYTFEPEVLNFACLRHNVDMNAETRGKIQTHRALLGAEWGTGWLLKHGANPGGHRCIFENDPAAEAYAAKSTKHNRGPEMTVMAIDNLGTDVDLICLDIEGAELAALRGARHTIQRCQPVIMFEERGHGTLHGHTAKDLEAFLKDAGYRFVRKVARDQIWAPR